MSAIYAFPCYAFTTARSAGSSTVAEVSSCSELTSGVDRDVCSHHVPVLKKLIREKNSQVLSTTGSPETTPGATPIPETVKIRKILATTERLDRKVFETVNPTLFIFDAEQSPGKGQPAVYELPLPESASGSRRSTGSFHLPVNSAFVGNGANILPEFVIEGGIQNHYVMSATDNDSVYYLANIEIDSRSLLDKSGSSTTAPTAHSGSTPTTLYHRPAGVLDLRGAGIFVADNIRVVLDPADNKRRVDPVAVGCRKYADGRGTEELFIYRFTHSEFDLLKNTHRATDLQSAAMNVECPMESGRVRLTMKNTKTVISVPTETDGPTPGLPKSSGVLFFISLWPEENILSFVDSTCNSIVDQFGNDLSIDSANPSDPDHYMGSVLDPDYCSNVKMIQGAFGLKDRDQAWGWIPVTHPERKGCWALYEKSYQAGFASVDVWSKAGVEVSCNCTTTTCAPSTTLLSTTQIPYAMPAADALVKNNNTDTKAGLTVGEKAGIGVGALVLDQGIAHTWFYLSNRIRQAWIRRTSQVLAATFGFGFPALQLASKCASGLKSQYRVEAMSSLVDQDQL
ncbi:hypothetical protein [Endozoicomonas sp. 4G]|uniref:hypothetical protein n=1 Tax=Endozoicomonas sp. 4G TaxID=2872754 RepID=UPI002078F51D|nr:hypothetical protein [Endozoicomonas sp. 4G]